MATNGVVVHHTASALEREKRSRYISMNAIIFCRGDHE
ncbi:hypothetical protein DAD186_19800 [Dermabacter vaginalis]|uniref:Uncharacterized protein n=1 Tax=Dermabacter vaginalis TaxID=1630135 RepID=A0A1B0ZKR8_9MICO|nr:hypothetical protein DAD186_19800 [Dermabacter vaginalis]